MQTSKLLSAMRGGIVVCIWSRLEPGAIYSSQLRTAFGCYSWLRFLQAIGQILGRYWKTPVGFLLCVSFSIFQAHNDAVWPSLHLVTQHVNRVPTEVRVRGALGLLLPLYHQKTRTGNRYQVQSNFDVTSFLHHPMSSSFSSLQNFIVGTDGPTNGRTDGTTKHSLL